ncbi:MAG: endonuclease NucS domain-containing protein [Terracidiphilus sp.]
MHPQIQFWTVKDNQLARLNEGNFAQAHKEKDLETWVEQDTSLLGKDLTVVGRQVTLPQVGTLDLLAIDDVGRLVIIEFKRRQTSRDAVAQILDYASYVRRLDLDALQRLPNVKAADTELSDINEFDPAMILVAAETDEATERIVQYLASKAKLPIEVVTFAYATLDDGREIIARSILIPETQPSASDLLATRLTKADLLKIAKDRGVLSFVETLYQVNAKLSWPEELLGRNGGTVRFWVRSPDGSGRVMFGMNVGGEKLGSPMGALDVWLRPEIAAEYSGLALEHVQEQIRQFHVAKETEKNLFVRVQDDASAAKLYSLLEEWDSTAGSEPPAASSAPNA